MPLVRIIEDHERRDVQRLIKAYMTLPGNYRTLILAQVEREARPWRLGVVRERDQMPNA